jgi:hypothetical protein
LKAADKAMAARGYRTHEFGDSVLIERTSRAPIRSESVKGGLTHHDSRSFFIVTENAWRPSGGS